MWRVTSGRHGVVWAAYLLFTAALLAGGGTRQDVAHDLIIQGLAVAFLALAWPGLKYAGWQQKALVVLALSAFALPLLQCIPLPGVLWQWAPGRAELYAASAQLGLSLPAWQPWSMDPTASLASARALLPALAMVVLAVQLRPAEFRVLAWILLAVVLLSVPLGLAQLAQGPHSELRFYRPTNIHEAVGLFANRNHFAALLAICGTVVLGGLAAALSSARIHSGRVPWIRAIALGLLLAILWFAIAQARSRAGMLLLLIAMVIAMLGIYRHAANRRWALGGMLIVVLLAGSVVLRHGFVGFADRLVQMGDQRIEVLPAVLSVGGHYGWLGTGAGSFPAVYALHEPSDLVGDRLLNHAHNDWAELAVEFGVLAVPVLIGFFYWLWRCWRSQGTGVDAESRRTPARASSIHWMRMVAAVVVFQLLLHSLLDYPLRTMTLSVVFVVALAALALPGDAAEADSAGSRSRGVRRVARTAP
jgi:O-antigen ligase